MFGDDLFSGSRFIRLTLCPILVLAAISLLATIQHLEPRGRVASGAVAGCGLLLALALFDGKRFAWAGRAATAIVFGFTLFYLVEATLIRRTPLHWTGSEGDVSTRNALAAFVTFGLPSLWYTLLGRFTLWRFEVRGKHDPRNWSRSGRWEDEAQADALARCPVFGLRFFDELFRCFPELAAEAVFQRWSAQADDVFALFDGAGITVQIDPQTECLVVHCGGDSAEFEARHGDPVAPALEHVGLLLDVEPDLADA